MSSFVLWPAGAVVGGAASAASTRKVHPNTIMAIRGVLVIVIACSPSAGGPRRRLPATVAAVATVAVQWPYFTPPDTTLVTVTFTVCAAAIFPAAS